MANFKLTKLEALIMDFMGEEVDSAVIQQQRANAGKMTPDEYRKFLVTLADLKSRLGAARDIAMEMTTNERHEFISNKFDEMLDKLRNI